MAAEVHIGDTGTILSYTIKDAGQIVDVSAATGKMLIVKNSENGPRKVLAGEFATDGTDGVIVFTSENDTWNAEGISQEQVLLVFPGWGNMEHEHRRTKGRR